MIKYKTDLYCFGDINILLAIVTTFKYYCQCFGAHLNAFVANFIELMELRTEKCLLFWSMHVFVFVFFFLLFFQMIDAMNVEIEDIMQEIVDAMDVVANGKCFHVP